MRTARKIAKSKQRTITKKPKMLVSPDRFFKYLKEKHAKEQENIENESNSESQLSVTPRRDLLDFTNPFESDTSLETTLQCFGKFHSITYGIVDSIVESPLNNYMSLHPPSFKRPARVIPRQLSPRVSTPRPGTPMPSPEKPTIAPRLPTPRREITTRSTENTINQPLFIVKQEPEDY